MKWREGVSTYVITILLVLVLIGIVADICLTVYFGKADLERGPRTGRTDLPCPAIPTKLILEDPECADKLVRAMNVTNVRILPRGSQVPQIDEEITERLANMSNRSRSGSSVFLWLHAMRKPTRSALSLGLVYCRAEPTALGWFRRGLA